MSKKMKRMLLERLCRITVVVGLLFLAGGPVVAHAQEIQQAVPQDDEAESVFQQGLEAFESGEYGMAYRRFRLVIDSYPLNRVTTAAAVMAAKALYRDGRYEQAIELAERFMRQYPTSSYVEEARRTRNFAAQQMEALATRVEPFELGIILPLTGSGDVAQSVFNGIRVAVESHNRASGDELPVRMVFRDTHGDPTTAREAVAELVREGVDAIIGPIFSDEARAAADEAERRQIVMLAPLATDEDVAEARQYVFQANPPITTRGRVMARHAMRDGGTRFGIVARLGDSIGERMAEGFQDEILQRGGEVLFYELLNSSSDWARIGSVVGSDTLAQTEALYLPLAGSNARGPAEAALRGLMEVGASVQVLGSDGWHDLPDRAAASEFETTYATDFYVEERTSAAETFRSRFESIAGRAPDRPAYTGYDVTSFLLSRRLDRPNDDLHRALHDARPYQGVGVRIDFSNGNVNEALYIFGYRDGRLELLR